MIYDFVEIGTSDFLTLAEHILDNETGISIEPISYYLDRLPDKPNVHKANYAMSNKMGSTIIYYVKPEDITKYNLPWWVRGCNSINAPHPTVKSLLGEMHDDIITVENVTLANWDFICNRYNITGIKLLKIDTEGHDAIILEDYFEYCEKHPNVLADEILFEYNVLADKQKTNDMINKFVKKGYIVFKPTIDDIKLIKVKLF